MSTRRASPLPALRSAALAAAWAATLSAVSALACTAHAQVAVRDAWVRATVPGQQATGMFATFTAQQDSKLVGASSPAAASVEVHEMKMEGDIMRMRAIAALPLPAGQAVALKPGSYHLMLMGLKKPLNAGSTVSLQLVVEDAQKTQSTLNISVPVQKAAPATGAERGHSHSHDHGHGAHAH